MGEPERWWRFRYGVYRSGLVALSEHFVRQSERLPAVRRQPRPPISPFCRITGRPFHSQARCNGLAGANWYLLHTPGIAAASPAPRSARQASISGVCRLQRSHCLSAGSLPERIMRPCLVIRRVPSSSR